MPPSFRERHRGPWSVELTSGGHYVVKDAAGVSLAYIYVERDDTKTQPSGLPPEEARTLAEAIRGLVDQT